MRGQRKAMIASLLVAAGAAAGALTGFGTGVAWSVTRLPALTPVAFSLLVVMAAVADAARLRPPSSRRQVPRLWSELLDPRVVAVLYGARLGVGPLTILVTWLWWAAALAAASLGPGPATVAGAVFGATRLLVVVAASELLRPAMPQRMARLRRAEPAARLIGGAIALAASTIPG